MTEDIVHEATYPYPPSEVWRVLTSPETLGSWLMETTFQEARVGHRFEFRDKPRLHWNGVTACEVLEVVPERRFVFSFGATEDAGREPPTKVSFDLEPAGSGTRVRMRHWGFTGFKGWLMRQGMNNGWGAIVRNVIPYVVEGVRAGRVPSREESREAMKKGRRAAHPAAKART